MKEETICFRTDFPDYTQLKINTYVFTESMYGNFKEFIPNYSINSLGKPFKMIHYLDANIYHEKINGRTVTVIFHFTNKTPIYWYSKKAKL